MSSGDKGVVNAGLLDGNTRATKLLNDEYKQVKEFDDSEGWEEMGDDMVIIDSSSSLKDTAITSDDFQLIGLDTDTPIFRVSHAFYKLKPSHTVNSNLVIYNSSAPTDKSSTCTHSILKATPISVNKKQDK